MTRRIRGARITIGFHGLALLRGWPFGDDETADRHLRAMRGLIVDSDSTIDVEPLDTASAYAAWAPVYDGANALVVTEEPSLRRMIDAVPAGGVAVDAGCGTGRVTAILLERSDRVVGIDASEEMLAVARPKVPAASLVRGDVSAIPIADEAVDVVTCALALTHVTDLNVAFAELSRITKAGGAVVTSDVHPLAVATGAHAFFTGTDGVARVAKNEVHWSGEYVDAAVRAGLIVEACEEPAMAAEALEIVLDEELRESLADAVTGLPFALVWRFRKA